jgi:hypothetical protein
MPQHIERIHNDYAIINDIKIMRNDFIKSSFITTENANDKLHTETISKILIENGFLINPIQTGRIFNQMNIGKYNKKCNINKSVKSGFEYIKYNP